MSKFCHFICQANYRDAYLTSLFDGCHFAIICEAERPAIRILDSFHDKFGVVAFVHTYLFVGISYSCSD